MFDVFTRIANRDAVLVGDFNYPGINWLENRCTTLEENFLNLSNDCFLHQQVKMPTRGENILDLLFSTEEGMIENLVVGDLISTSDHNSLWFEVTGAGNNSGELIKNEYYFNSNKADYTKMNEEIRDIDWEACFLGCDVNGAWIKFKEILLKLVQKYVRKSKVKGNKRNKVWFNKDVEKLRNAKLKAWQKYRKAKTHENWERYKIVRNEY